MCLIAINYQCHILIFIAFILIDLFSSPQPLYELLPNTKMPRDGLWCVFG